MALKRLPLVAVKRPCDARWEAMHGSNVSRRCADCDREVYDLGAMTTEEAELLLRDSLGRLCVTFARGPDGQPITADRPARFRWGPLATASHAAATAALTMAMAGGVVVLNGDAVAYAQAATRRTPSPAPSGGLRGSVRVRALDEPAEGASIRARDQKTGQEFATETNNDGSYRLSLPKGRYDVSISVPGFTACHVEGIDIGGRLLTADARLDLSVLGEVIYPPGYDGCHNKKISRLGHKKTGKR